MFRIRFYRELLHHNRAKHPSRTDECGEGPISSRRWVHGEPCSSIGDRPITYFRFCRASTLYAPAHRVCAFQDKESYLRTKMHLSSRVDRKISPQRRAVLVISQLTRRTKYSRVASFSSPYHSTTSGMPNENSSSTCVRFSS